MRNFLLLLLLMYATTLEAQQRGKVAIVHPPYQWRVLDSIVRNLSIEPVEIDTVLPSNLNQYDAVFASMEVDSATEIRLLNYIDSGGKLYIDLDAFFTSDSLDSLEAPFWFQIGVRSQLLTDLNIFVTAVEGTVSFTGDIYDSLPPYRYEIGYGGVSGMINPILVAHDDANMSTTLAFTSDDSSLKVVVDEGALNYQIPGDYYQKLIADVVCNYFNLCAEGVQSVPLVSKPFHIIRDPRENGYSVSADFINGGKVSVLNSMGIVLWQTTVKDGASIQELPADLKSGFYFVRVESGEFDGVKPLAVIY